MSPRTFGHSKGDLAYRLNLLFNFTKFFSKRLDIPFAYELSDFAEALPHAVQDTLYYCIDYKINPNGYDTAKLTAFLAYHLIKRTQHKFNAAPMFYGYIALLQHGHAKPGWPNDYLEKGIPHLKCLCENLHTFMNNLNSPVPSYAFLKGIQLSLRATSSL